MIRRKTTKTTVEKRELYLIRKPRGSRRVRCRECTQPVELITLEEAVQLAGVSSRAIYRWIECEAIHFDETIGVALICPASLLKQLSKQIE